MNATVAKLSVPAVLFLTKSTISGNILECLKELAQQHDMAVFNGNKEKNARVIAYRFFV